MPTFIVPPLAEPLPAKSFLRAHAGISLTLWRRIKRSDHFLLNRQRVNPALAVVCSGDEISYTVEYTTSIPAADLPLAIRYEDEYLLVLDKRAGQLVHPTVAKREDTLANAVLGYYRRRALPYAFHPVHRLDKNTSGLGLVAKLPQIQHLLCADPKRFHRLYLALVEKAPRPAQGAIRLPIARRAGSIIERTVDPAGQSAVTHYKTLYTGQTAALLALRLETGRTHQIRVHLAHIGSPLLGDDLYGGSVAQIQRQALHAARLRFFHPVTGKRVVVSSPLPADLRLLLEKIRPSK